MIIPFEKRKEIRFRRKISGLLSDWYGEEAAQNEISAHTGKCRPIKDAVNDLLAQIDFSGQAEFESIAENWSEICGKAIAKYTKPLELTPEKILLVGVTHSAFLRDLQPAMRLVLHKIQQQYSAETCTEIKLVSRMS